MCIKTSLVRGGDVRFDLDGGGIVKHYLAALQDDLFDEQPGHRQVHRSHRYQLTGALPWKQANCSTFSAR